MKIKSFLVITASSVAFLASCGCSNNRDQQFLNQINQTLKDHNEIVTCNDAINILKANNIDIFSYQFSNLLREFAYDFDAKQFVVMQNDAIVCSPSGYSKNQNNFSYFKFTNTYNGNSIYSQYLLDDFPETQDLIVTTGIDVGNHKDIKNVTYAGSVGLERNINIRVYCDYLTIIADSDTVNYYGNANNIFVGDVKTFNVYGANSYIQLRDGTTNFKKGSATDFLEVPTNYTTVITATQEDGALIYCAINKPEGISATELSVTEIDNEDDFRSALTDQTKPFIRLTNDIVDSNETGFSINTDKIIDLNGFSISTTELIDIDENCYLIDTEYSYNENCGIILSGGRANISVNAYLLMNGGNVVATNIGRSGAINVINSGVFDMYGGQIIASSSDGCYAIMATDSASVNINYATITSNGSVFGSNNDAATLNINAGTFASENGYYCLDNYGGTVNIYGGTFTANSCIKMSDHYEEDSTVNIYGGSFYSQGHYIVGEGILGSTIVIEDNESTDAYSCTINIDNAYLFSRYGYICSVYGAGKTNVTINCNSGIYDYYLGGGVSVMEGLEERVTINQGGTWTNHEYA